ncbi:MAG TPA: hypothetical protein DCZ48_12470 [Methylococcaceae bacterium]|nr:hypothetical protein [Methylococcaceae bacterium]
MTNDRIFDAVAARLKHAVDVRTDSQLAGKLGISASAYANLKARGSIPHDKVISLALAHNVNIHWLFTGEEVQREGRPAIEPSRQADQRIRQLDEKLTGLSDRQLNHIETMVEEFQTFNHLMNEVAGLKAEMNRALDLGEGGFDESTTAD